jgi:hypothetical protein
MDPDAKGKNILILAHIRSKHGKLYHTKGLCMLKWYRGCA